MTCTMTQNLPGRIVRATPGTVSHGTLRTEDLICAFHSELMLLTRPYDGCRDAAVDTALRPARAALDAVDDYAQARAELLAAGADVDPNDDCAYALVDRAHDIVEELSDALSLFAPEGHYFGAHPGDDADFGFWPCESDEP